MAGDAFAIRLECRGTSAKNVHNRSRMIITQLGNHVCVSPCRVCRRGRLPFENTRESCDERE